MGRTRRWLAGFALAAGAIAAAFGWRAVAPGRYQIVADRGLVHRLDTASGELQMLAISDSDRRTTRAAHYWLLAVTDEASAPGAVPLTLAAARARAQEEATRAQQAAAEARAAAARAIDEHVAAAARQGRRLTRQQADEELLLEWAQRQRLATPTP